MARVWTMDGVNDVRDHNSSFDKVLIILETMGMNKFV